MDGRRAKLSLEKIEDDNEMSDDGRAQELRKMRKGKATQCDDKRGGGMIWTDKKREKLCLRELNTVKGLTYKTYERDRAFGRTTSLMVAQNQPAFSLNLPGYVPLKDTDMKSKVPRGLSYTEMFSAAVRSLTLIFKWL